MTGDTGAPGRVLAVMDDSDSQTALRTAAGLCEHHGAALDVLVCVEPPHDLDIIAQVSGIEPHRLMEALTERAGTEASSRLQSILPERQIEPDVVVGKAFIEIIRYVGGNNCDFVVKTAEPLSGMQRFLYASTDQHLLRKCPCPVWLQTASAPVAPKRVLAAVDLDVRDAAEPETLMELNRRVVDAARGVATANHAEVTVVHAWEAQGEGMVWAFSSSGDARMSADQYINEVLSNRQQAMNRFLASIDEKSKPGPRLVPCLARGSPQKVIEEQSRQLAADVVVMGTLARTGLSGVFIGNTAENIINSLACPVLAVKPEGFISPLL
ncbi:MAG: universal stress protein [Pseudomonadota bacterium]